MTATSDADSFLLGSGVASAKFTHPGDTVTGSISEQPEKQQQRDFSTGEPKTWPNTGEPMWQLRVILQTTDRDSVDDDGLRAVYLKGKSQKAVADAVRRVKADGLRVGGTITLTYTGDDEPKQRGFNGEKLYTAEYAPPAVRAADAFLGATPAAPAPVSPPAAQFTPEQLAAMQAAGIDTSKLGG